MTRFQVSLLVFIIAVVLTIVYGKAYFDINNEDNNFSARVLLFSTVLWGFAMGVTFSLVIRRM